MGMGRVPASRARAFRECCLASISVGCGVRVVGCEVLGVVRACVLCVTSVHVRCVQKTHTARCRASHGLVKSGKASVVGPHIRALVTNPSQHSFRYDDLCMRTYEESECAGRTWWCRRPCARDQHFDDEDDRATDAKPEHHECTRE